MFESLKYYYTHKFFEEEETIDLEELVEQIITTILEENYD